MSPIIIRHGIYVNYLFGFCLFVKTVEILMIDAQDGPARTNACTTQYGCIKTAKRVVEHVKVRITV